MSYRRNFFDLLASQFLAEPIVGPSERYAIVSNNHAANFPGNITGAGPRTVEFWFKHNAIGGRQGVFTMGNTQPGQDFSFYCFHSDPENSYYHFNGWQQDLFFFAPMITTRFIHIGLVYDGAIFSMYIDKKLAISQPLALNTTASYSTIGYGIFNGSTLPVTGLRMWTRALSAAEIKANASSPVNPAAADLWAAPDFNTPNVALLNDLSPNDRDFTVAGGVTWIST
jgi:hypothetical protein